MHLFTFALCLFRRRQLTFGNRFIWHHSLQIASKIFLSASKYWCLSVGVGWV